MNIGVISDDPKLLSRRDFLRIAAGAAVATGIPILLPYYGLIMRSEKASSEIIAGIADASKLKEGPPGNVRQGGGGDMRAWSAPTFLSLSPTALAVRLDADIPQDTDLVIEVRSGADTEHWSPWAPLYTPGLDGDGRRSFENLITAAPGERWAQARVRFRGPNNHLPTLRALSLVPIDASRGPSTAQIMGSAQTRQSRSARSAGLSAPIEAQNVPQPTIISRAEWGANEDWMTWPPEYSPVRKIIIHHTVTGNDEADPAAIVRAIYYYHAVVRGWGDIAYNYLVDRYGNIYEGRAGGANVVGGHTTSYNVGSVGIGVLGTFGNASGSTDPSSTLVNAIAKLCAWVAARNGIDPLGQSLFIDVTAPNIAGHRDYDITSCPGDYLYVDLDPIRQATRQLMQQGTLPARRAQFGAHTTPMTIAPHQTVRVNVTVRNTGSMTWPASGDHPVHLGYRWYDQNSQQVIQPPEDDHRKALPRDLGPSEEVSLNIRLTAPGKPGVYMLKWDMVQENVTWFADRGSPTLDVTVTVGQGASPTPAPPTPKPGTTPDSGATPPPSACQELFTNGDFESDGGWTINVTERVATYTDLRHDGGRRSILTGVPPGGWNMDSYSSIEQSVSIPAQATSAILRFGWLPLTDDPVNDSQYVVMRDESGTWHTLLMEHSNAGTWQQAEFDLTAFAGQTVTIRFGSYNNGRDGVTSLWIDDASLTVCLSS